MKIHRSLTWVLLVLIGVGALQVVAPIAKVGAADEHAKTTEGKEDKADAQSDAKKDDDKDDEKGKKDDKAKKEEEEDKIVATEHVATIHGKEIKYTATAGKLVMKNDEGKPKAHVFFIAYTKNGVEDLGQRPITFAFNGGPGSSSVWLHLGMLGPQRVKVPDDASPLRRRMRWRTIRIRCSISRTWCSSTR